MIFENLLPNRWVYLSPHLDDAVLSCGGIIFEQRKAGISVEIWNWMSGIPPGNAPLSDLARSVHSEWGLVSAKEVLSLRLAEDRLAALRVDASPRYFDFLDCIYRRDENGTALYDEDIFTPPHPADRVLVDKIAALIKENLRPNDILISPLTIGNHPDHVIIRRAAEKTGHPLLYYADMPYMLRHPEQLAEMMANLSAEVYPVTEEGLLVWQEAASAYASQLTVLFGGEVMMKNALKSNWQTRRSIALFK